MVEINRATVWTNQLFFHTKKLQGFSFCSKSLWIIYVNTITVKVGWKGPVDYSSTNIQQDFAEKRGVKSWKNQMFNLVVNLDRKDIKVSFCSKTFLLKLLIILNGMMRDAYARWPWEWCTLEMYDCNASAIQWWNFSHANEMVNMTWCNCHDAGPMMQTLWCNDDNVLDVCM